MRIIAGKYKGHVIHAPKSIPARPTTDRSKESLFNILNNRLDLEGLRVLDLFSGTGNMAFEFASRGAKLVHAVDQHATAVHFINSSFETLGYKTGKAFKANALTFFNRASQPYDLIFADPPYGLPGIPQFVEAIMTSTLLQEGGLFILEHAVQVVPGDKSRVDYRVYGQSAFSFYEKTATFETKPE
ncbi:MAG TPA: 16S rRNA (guanine(966)-N(2))-methyltransferase RsmD [Bacteroidetes bacterium]|nr:16S rRNA (guanine(966)-N(2))-methyltransferase RsmD [Bacteroidota bacterium]